LEERQRGLDRRASGAAEAAESPRPDFVDAIAPIRHFGQPRLPDVGRGALSPELERYFRVHLEVATKSRRDTPVVFYCFADCWMGWNTTKRAASWGFTRLYWYRDGIDGWEAAKLPVAEAEPVPDS